MLRLDLEDLRSYFGYDQGFMLITRGKQRKRDSYKHFIEVRQGIIPWVKSKLIYEENCIKLVVG